MNIPLSAAALQARIALSCPYYLAVTAGCDAGLVLGVPAQRQLCLGRGEVLSDPFLSREQLKLQIRKNKVIIIDTNGTNPSHWHSTIKKFISIKQTDVKPGETWHPGKRIFVGESVFQLRRRPQHLKVARVQKSKPKKALTPLILIASLAIFAYLLWSTNLFSNAGTNRHAAMFTLIPLVLMYFTRLPTRDKRNKKNYKLGTGLADGWHKKRPDPCQMLLLLAQKNIAQSENSPELSAWTDRRYKRNIIQLHANEEIAFRGAGAENMATWWCAQIVTAGAGYVQTHPRTWHITWGNSVHPAQTNTEPEKSEYNYSAHISIVNKNQIPTNASYIKTIKYNLSTFSSRWRTTAHELFAFTQDVENSHKSRKIDESGLKTSVPLSSIIGETDRNRIVHQWREHKFNSHKTLPAILGQSSSENITVDLVAHGPHALIAGTTGSGKSELLTAWLLQLALFSSPDYLTFILVDYKGGAAFGSLANLPHTAGVLTDLTPALTARALTSLEAEVRRRERLLARYGAKDLQELTTFPAATIPPRIVIAVDEFATLSASHPEVLDALVRIAAQGRSLGLHLILATQRPAGIISGAIRANTALRLCLRVLDKEDSRDVLGHDQAAYLSAIPGRLMICGLEALHGKPLQAPWCAQGQNVRQIVQELQIASTMSAVGKPWRPWAPPLPKMIRRNELKQFLPPLSGAHKNLDLSEAITAPIHSTADIALRPAETQKINAQVLLALCDEPEAQCTRAWAWDYHSPLLVLGTAASGRSTTLISAALGYLTQNSSGKGGNVHLCGLPATMRAQWPGLNAGAKGVGTCVGSDDPRRLARLWDLALNGSLSGDLLVLDDIDQLLSSVDDSRGPGQGLAMLEALCRVCTTVETRLVISGGLNLASTRWASSIPTRLVLGACDPAQAALAGLPRGVTGENGLGRAVLQTSTGTRTCQIAIPHHSEGGQQTATPIVLHKLPMRVSHLMPSTAKLDQSSSLPAPSTKAENTGACIWAVGGDYAQPLPPPPGNTLVVGPCGSGRSTALRMLSYCYDKNQPLVIDDLDLLDANELTKVQQALTQGRHIIAAATTEHSANTYRGVLAELRARSELIILWPALGPAAQVAGMDLRSASDPRAPTCPGRGVLIRHSQAIPLQIASDGL